MQSICAAVARQNRPHEKIKGMEGEREREMRQKRGVKNERRVTERICAWVLKVIAPGCGKQKLISLRKSVT